MTSVAWAWVLKSRTSQWESEWDGAVGSDKQHLGGASAPGWVGWLVGGPDMWGRRIQDGALEEASGV